MTRYRFTRPMKVDGKRFKEGREISENEIPADHLECCLNNRYVVKLEERPTDAAKQPAHKRRV